MVRLINTIIGAEIYSTGIDSENSGPQNIIVIGPASSISPTVIGNARVIVRLRDLFMTDEKLSISPDFIRWEQRGNSTVPNDVIRVRQILDILFPAVKKPTASSPLMNPSMTEFSSKYRLVIRYKAKIFSAGRRWLIICKSLNSMSLTDIYFLR